MPEGTTEYSRATAELIDRKVQEITGIQYERAKDNLLSKKEVIEEAVRLLLEKEFIVASDLEVILDGYSGESNLNEHWASG